MNIIFWVLQGILALAFLMAGIMKITQPLERLSKQMKWVNDTPPALVRFIGVTEALGAIGLVLPAATGILPWLTPLAAAGLAVVMLLAAGYHTQRKEFNQIAPSLVLMVLVVVVVVGRVSIEPFNY